MTQAHAGLPGFYKTRILLIDDNDAIHQDLRKLLLQDLPDADSKAHTFHLTRDEPLHEIHSSKLRSREYQIDSAFQGATGLEMVKQAIQENQPYSLVFVTAHEPSDRDGIHTIQRLWEVDPDLQFVICGMHTNHTIDYMRDTLENKDSYLVLNRPFDHMEIRQAAASMIKKWELTKQNQKQIQQVEKLINTKTKTLSESLAVFKATLEATEEGILGIDIKLNKINAFNQNILSLWDLEESLLNQGDARIVFEQMAEKTDASHLFMQHMSNLDEPIHNFCKEWTLLSGKTLELYVQTQYADLSMVGYVLSFRDITHNKQLEANLLHLATHDTLTGLPNRALLHDRLEQAIAQTAKSGLGVGVLLLDIDHFKSINETLGYACGDELLKTVSKKLIRFIRESETVTRLGNDEFVLILPRVKTEDLVIKANELLNIFTAPLLIHEHFLNITASIGISIYPKDGKDQETLLKNADYALYQAKAAGQNIYQFYASEFSEYLRAREQLIADLQNALQENQLTLYYQPLINLNSKKISGVEALLRWNHPTRGLLYPPEFLGAIEESGLMPAIGEWVLKTACLQAKIWHDTVNSTLSMAVNISPTQFKQNNFISLVNKILTETQINPSRLEFEITENLLLDNATEVVKKMQDLKNMGIKFSLDDFGTGYASLSYLKSFPFDKIKIDPSFVSGIMESRVDRSIIEAALMMTQRIGVTVVAEGVTTAEEVEFLKQHAAEACQGFYFSPAVGEEDCARLLKKGEIP